MLKPVEEGDISHLSPCSWMRSDALDTWWNLRGGKARVKLGINWFSFHNKAGGKR